MSWDQIGKEDMQPAPQTSGAQGPKSKLMAIIWVGPHDPPIKCIDSWKDAHLESKGWRFRVVTSDQGWRNQRVIDGLTDWGAKADCIKYEILEALGIPGVCVDADIECLQPLDAETPAGRSITEFFPSGMEAFASYESETAVPGLISTAFIGGVPGAAFWRRCVEEVGEIDLEDKRLKKLGGAAELVGSGLLTKVAKEISRDKLTVHSSRVVNPIHSSGVRSPMRGANYGNHYWGTCKTYNTLRKWPCQCPVCRGAAPSWRLPWM